VPNTIRPEWLAELAELRERARLACEEMRRNIHDYRAIAARRRWANGDSLHELHLGAVFDNLPTRPKPSGERSANEAPQKADPLPSSVGASCP
jgi:hypothetical protein